MAVPEVYWLAFHQARINQIFHSLSRSQVCRRRGNISFLFRRGKDTGSFVIIYQEYPRGIAVMRSYVFYLNYKQQTVLTQTPTIMVPTEMQSTSL